jgi:hypothetical protein
MRKFAASAQSVVFALCVLSWGSGCAHMETVAHRQYPHAQNQEYGASAVVRIQSRSGAVYVSDIDGVEVERDSQRVRERYLDRYQWAWFLTGGFGFFSLWQLWPEVDIVEVLPGEHTLAVEYYESSSVNYGSYIQTKTWRSTEPLYLNMIGQAGHRYRLQGDYGFSLPGASAWSARLDDVTDNEPREIGRAVRKSLLGVTSTQSIPDQVSVTLSCGGTNTPLDTNASERLPATEK